MIYSDSKKLHLIECIIKETNDDVLKKIGNILSPTTKVRLEKFANFSNVLSAVELSEFEKSIETNW